MKAIIATLILITALSAFAGPEEHQQAQKCYGLSATDSKRVTGNLPTQICLETLTINPINDSIDVYSYFFPNLFKNMKLDKLIRKNEDSYAFHSSKIFYFSDDEQNGQLERLTLILKGEVDFMGSGDPSAVFVEVKQETRFTPHSAIHTTVFHYELQ